MKKTLYISDLDGTLLNSRAEVSEKSKAIISRLITEKNILFSVATARTPATVVRMLDGIENRLPYIVMTGAAMWNNALSIVAISAPRKWTICSKPAVKQG